MPLGNTENVAVAAAGGLATAARIAPAPPSAGDWVSQVGCRRRAGM